VDEVTRENGFDSELTVVVEIGLISAQIKLLDAKVDALHHLPLFGLHYGLLLPRYLLTCPPILSSISVLSRWPITWKLVFVQAMPQLVENILPMREPIDNVVDIRLQHHLRSL
jgi:hypothetical protein